MCCCLCRFVGVDVTLPDAGYTVLKPKVDCSVNLCNKAYCLTTGLPLKTYSNYRRAVRKGLVGQPLRGRPVGTKSSAHLGAKTWLAHYAAQHDRVPNQTFKNQPVVGKSSFPTLGREVLTVSKRLTCGSGGLLSWCGGARYAQ